MSDSIRRLHELHERARHVVGPMHDFVEKLQSVSGAYGHLGAMSKFAHLAKSINESQRLLGAFQDFGVAGKFVGEMREQQKLFEAPFDQVRRMGMLDPSSELRRTLATEHDRYKGLFQLPAVADVGRLARAGLGSGTLAEALVSAPSHIGAVESAMLAMRSPWLRLNDELRSARAFGDLIGIGYGVATLPPFQSPLVQGLRSSLGDWRDAIVIHEDWQDPVPRLGYYNEQGFDFALTDFTHEGFTETTEAAGLNDTQAVDQLQDDEAGVARSRQAFARLHELERAIRLFIANVMEAAYGSDWMKRQLPVGMLDQWTAKRDKAVMDGCAPEPLINYADFTEYKAIIERQDNWSTVFKPVFKRPENIRESFQRLFPLRIATMHARLITSEDELLLMVEVRRIMRAVQS
ncbi:MAG: hypothetical protein ACRDBH_05415 [Bosea sp. (in: a-proteobacteria)]